MPSSTDQGGLGSALVGEKIVVNHRQVSVTKLLGEGGFSYVYLVREIADEGRGGSLSNTVHGDSVSRSSQSGRSGSLGNGAKRQGSMGRGADGKSKEDMVLKVTSILSRQQRDIAEKEAKLLSRLSHPSIIKMYDTCYRTMQQKSGKSKNDDKTKERPMHLILMEFCEGGHALEVCTDLAKAGERFDLSTLIIAFGQICNAVSYLHAQRPPIVHRDLKPANFLVKNGAYKLCDFGSAVFGHVELKTPQQRMEAEEVIEKTTTQMFRAPEMVDLHMAKKLTQATDVWALGACLYSMAFLQNCFEEGSNLAILNRNYKIPDDNPYGDGLVELLDRMLTVDSKARADMTEIILCLSAVYSGRPLPPRKERKDKGSSSSSSKKEKDSSSSSKSKKSSDRVGTFRTDGQGIIQEDLTIKAEAVEAKTATKLNPNSAAFRRRQAAAAEIGASSHSRDDDGAAAKEFGAFDADGGFFASADTDDVSDDNLGFGSFDDNAAAASTDAAAAWGNLSQKDAFASFDPESTTDMENVFGATSAENGEGDDKPKEDMGEGDADACPTTPVKGRTRSAPKRGSSSMSTRQSRSSDRAARSPGRSTHHRRSSDTKEKPRRSSSRNKDDDADKDAGGEGGEMSLESLRDSLAAPEEAASKPEGKDRRRSSRGAPSRTLSSSKHSGRRSRPGHSSSRRDATGDAAKKLASAGALSFD